VIVAVNNKNMKNLTVIRPHSFVDVITNSSTELFVCNTEKNLEMVKEVLQKILSGFNMMNDSSFSMDVFKEPFVFSIIEYRKWRKEDRKLQKECQKTGNWEERWKLSEESNFSNIIGCFYDDEDKEDVENLRKSYIEEGNRSGGVWSSRRNPFYQRLQDAAKDKDGKFDYDLKDKEVKKIYKEISKQEIKPDWWNKPWEYYYRSTVVRELNGAVIIAGKSDNSIPYDIWDTINSKLNGNNYHLG
jgi:hypothetical protein